MEGPSSSSEESVDSDRERKDRRNKLRREKYKNDPHERARTLETRRRRKAKLKTLEGWRDKLNQINSRSRDRYNNDPVFKARRQAADKRSRDKRRAIHGPRKQHRDQQDRLNSSLPKTARTKTECDNGQGLSGPNQFGSPNESRLSCDVSFSMTITSGGYVNVVHVNRTDKLARRDGFPDQSEEERRNAEHIELLMRTYVKQRKTFQYNVYIAIAVSHENIATSYDPNSIPDLLLTSKLETKSNSASKIPQLYIGSVRQKLDFCSGMYPAFYGPNGANIDPSDPHTGVFRVYQQTFSSPDSESVKMQAEMMEGACQFIMFIRANHLEDPKKGVEEFLNTRHECTKMIKLDDICPVEAHNPQYEHTKLPWMQLLIFLAIRPDDYPIIDYASPYISDIWRCGQCICAKGAGFCVVNLRLDPSKIKIVNPLEDKQFEAVRFQWGLDKQKPSDKQPVG